jgi:hypothetical protein
MAGNIDLAAMTWSPKLLKTVPVGSAKYLLINHEKAAGKRLVLAKLFFNISEKCTD